MASEIVCGELDISNSELLGRCGRGDSHTLQSTFNVWLEIYAGLTWMQRRLQSCESVILQHVQQCLVGSTMAEQ